MFLRAEAHGFFICLIVIGAVQYDFATVATRGRNLNQRRRQRHDDFCPNAEIRSVVGNGLCVIAGGGGNHS